jgi:glycine/D-amino acid oxidase-like deaminating enzyme
VRLLLHKISQDPGLPCKKPTTSFWQQDPPHPDLATNQSVDLPRQTDVLVIGSGITAASVSHHLLTSDDKISVLVAEARTITSGATGRNGGHIVEVPYEDYDFHVSLMGRSATKEIVQFRLDHLAELVETSKSQMTEKAANESEIRVVEVADAAFDQTQWNKVKRQLASFLEDFPEQRTKWKALEKDEARKVNVSKPFRRESSDVSIF